MELQGRTCAIEPFSTAQAVIKAKFDTAPIEGAFNRQLVDRLSGKGLLVQEIHPGLGQADVTIEGQFVLIDEGNRAQRYFLTGLAGSAALEVEGRLFFGDVPVTELHARVNRTAGFFGGGAQQLLQTAAVAAARQIADLVIAALQER